MKSLRFLLIFFAFIFFLNPIPYTLHPVFAQSKNTITVMPQLTKLDLKIDKPEAEIFYTNSTSNPVELSLRIEDVRELEDRSPVGILDPKEAENYKYSLSSWAYLSTQSLILKPGETRSIKVGISGDKLSPGGHYGTVLAEIHQSSDNKKVQVKGVLASLLFVRAGTGNVNEEAKVVDFNASTNVVFPDALSFRLQNTGNIDLTPYGILIIKDGNDQTVAKGVVNEDSLITLPEAIRKYEFEVKPLKNVILPGKYKAILQIHFGKSNKQIEVKKEFFTAGNPSFLWVALYTGLGILVSLFVFKLILRKLSTSH